MVRDGAAGAGSGVRVPRSVAGLSSPGGRRGPGATTGEPRSWWSVLVDVLGSVGEVSAREPVGLVVSTRRGDVTRRRIEVVMTEDEWDSVVSIMWGEVEEAAQHVRQLVLQQPPDKPYLVYSQYMLEPSVDPVLPVGPT